MLCISCLITAVNCFRSLTIWPARQPWKIPMQARASPRVRLWQRSTLRDTLP